MKKVLTGLLVLVASLFLATTGVQAGGGAPVVVPHDVFFFDLNPCTGEWVRYDLTGTERIQAFDDHFISQAKGTIVTEGFSGRYHWQLVIHGDRVFHASFHDWEVSDETGQRIMFAIGVIHETSVDGQPVVSFVHLSGLRCVGPPG